MAEKGFNMLKRLALVVLFGINNLHAIDALNKAGFIEKIKNSPTIVKVVGGIIPCIVVVISMDAVMRAYEDNQEKLNIVNIAYHIKGVSLFITTLFYSWLLRMNLKKWFLDSFKNNKIVAAGAVNINDTLLLGKTRI